MKPETATRAHLEAAERQWGRTGTPATLDPTHDPGVVITPGQGPMMTSTLVLAADVQHTDRIYRRGRPAQIVAIHDGTKGRTFVVALRNGDTEHVSLRYTDAVEVAR